MTDTNSVIPVSITDRELLISLIEESVGYLNEQDKIKANLKEVREVATDKLGKLAMEGKVFNALVKAAYDSSKIKQQVRQLQDSLDDLSVLFKDDFMCVAEDDQDEQ